MTKVQWRWVLRALNIAIGEQGCLIDAWTFRSGKGGSKERAEFEWRKKRFVAIRNQLAVEMRGDKK